MAKADWETIKTEYITTNTSQRKLADKYGINATTIAHRCKTEEWVKYRQLYKRKTLAKTIKKSANREANRLARLMDTTSKAIDVTVKAFADENQFNRYLIERREKYAYPDITEDEESGSSAVTERQWTEEQIFKKIDTKALRDLTAALKDLTGLMRDFYNIPTPAQAEAQRIAAERLEMDKRKEDAGNDNSGGIEIVFDAGPEEWNE